MLQGFPGSITYYRSSRRRYEVSEVVPTNAALERRTYRAGTLGAMINFSACFASFFFLRDSSAFFSLFLHATMNVLLA